MLREGNAANRRVTSIMKRAAVLCLAVAAVFLFTGSGFGKDLAFKAEVDKVKLAATEVLTYKLTVDSTLKDIPKPSFPDFSGFNVISEANTSHISVSGGTKNVSLGYVFMLRPTEAGTFTIKPAELKIGDKIYSSAEFKIEVGPPGTETGVMPKAVPGDTAPDKEDGEPPAGRGPSAFRKYPEVTL